MDVTPVHGLLIPTHSDEMPLWPSQYDQNATYLENLMRYEEGTYTPEWEAEVTPPTLGTSTVEGRWCRLWPNLVIAWGSITVGSGFSAGSGIYSLGLPFICDPILKSGTSGRGSQIGTATLTDISTPTTSGNGGCMPSPVDRRFRINLDASAGSMWQPTAPFNLAVGDIAAWQVIYPTEEPWS